MKPTPTQFLLGEPAFYTELAHGIPREMKAEFTRQRPQGIPRLRISLADTGEMISNPVTSTKAAVAFLERLP